MRTNARRLAVSLLALTTIVSSRAAAAAAAGMPPAAAKEAGEIFAARCALCHGANGKGDGAAAAGFNPKPQDYSDAKWQASITDQEIEKIIVEGGAAAGKSAMMPANPDLAAKPDVVKALRATIRAFGSKTAATR